jgi:hypothetical protein
MNWVASSVPLQARENELDDIFGAIASACNAFDGRVKIICERV